MFDVVTFGSATLDVFVSYKKIGISLKNKRKGIFLPLGEKLEGENMFFYSGGGGTNSAATFGSQGFKTAFCGMIGNDFAGKVVLEDLSRFNVDRRFVFKTNKESTGMSVIFSGSKGKVILPYRGASRLLSARDVPLKELKAKWFYLAPLSGKLVKDYLKIIDFAKKNKIKTALNPSKYQLRSSEIKKALEKVDVLILNQEEAGFLTKTSFKKEKIVFKKLDKLVDGICIMTKGKQGATVSDGRFLYTVPALKVKLVDATGAGDSFGSGFIVEYINSSDIALAIQFAMANSTANIEEWGAKDGILKKGQKWKKVKVKIQKL
ncbi:MAG: carbohydrate kinase family protein [Patescibacteria group bacterium]|nr:carbohydrate kinase family protein [Patescibacteria group bacterium]